MIRCDANSIALVVNAGLNKFKSIVDKVQAFVVEIQKSPKKRTRIIYLSKKSKYQI